MSIYNSEIRVMTYNIRYDNPEDGKNSWKYRRDMAAGIFGFHHVHIAGLQEVLLNQMSDLKERLPEYGFIGVGREDGKSEGEFAPVVYLKARFEPMDKGVFWLSETPYICGSMGWDAACTRIATWAKFNDKYTGKVLFFFNTHFDHVGTAAMRNSAYLLKDMVHKIAGKNPAIITGDFNNTEDSEVYAILVGKNSDEEVSSNSFKDSKYESIHGHYGSNISFHDFEAAEYFYFTSMQPEVKDKHHMSKMETIDYIFVKNEIQVVHHGNLSDTWDGKYPSDHMPVVSDITI